MTKKEFIQNQLDSANAKKTTVVNDSAVNLARADAVISMLTEKIKTATDDPMTLNDFIMLQQPPMR